MDKQEAQFILGSFRPDGADAHDATFTEALQLAVEDRELGDWLAGERASDAEFTSALNDVEIPDQLRLHILAMMRGEEIHDPEAEQAMDEALSGALDEVEPPAGLRDQILVAMNVQQEQESNVISIDTAGEKKGGWLNIKSISSMAAALVLGGFLALQMNVLNSDGVMSAQAVQLHTGNFVNASFDFDVKSSDDKDLKSWLASNDLPSQLTLPDQLANMQIEGYKKLELPEDQSGSLLYFKEGDNEAVHVIVVKNDMIKDLDIPLVDGVTKEDCYFCIKTGWDVASWQDDENTYIMMAKPQQEGNNTLVRYF